MTYVFQSLRANVLINPGDKIGIATPIFSPYLEIPVLDDYQLEIVDIRMDRALTIGNCRDLNSISYWTRRSRYFAMVNPSNPPSIEDVRCRLWISLTALVTKQRPDLFMVTDDVYGTFADDFISIFAKCPRNTLVRLLVLEVLRRDGLASRRHRAARRQRIRCRPSSTCRKNRSSSSIKRYASLTTKPRGLRFIDRLVADSRAVALEPHCRLVGAAATADGAIRAERIDGPRASLQGCSQAADPPEISDALQQHGRQGGAWAERRRLLFVDRLAGDRRIDYTDPNSRHGLSRAI